MADRIPRGEQRFAAITYSKLAEWTGLTLATIRSYGSKGRIPKHDLAATMRWVNERRAAKGLPHIGDPRVAAPDAKGRVWFGDVPTGATYPATQDDETTTEPPVPSEDVSTKAPTSPLIHPASCRCHSCYLASKAAKR